MEDESYQRIVADFQQTVQSGITERVKGRLVDAVIDGSMEPEAVLDFLQTLQERMQGRLLDPKDVDNGLKQNDAPKTGPVTLKESKPQYTPEQFLAAQLITKKSFADKNYRRPNVADRITPKPTIGTKLAGPTSWKVLIEERKQAIPSDNKSREKNWRRLEKLAELLQVSGEITGSGRSLVR